MKKAVKVLLLALSSTLIFSSCSFIDDHGAYTPEEKFEEAIENLGYSGIEDYIWQNYSMDDFAKITDHIYDSDFIYDHIHEHYSLWEVLEWYDEQDVMVEVVDRDWIKKYAEDYIEDYIEDHLYDIIGDNLDIVEEYLEENK